MLKAARRVDEAQGGEFHCYQSLDFQRYEVVNGGTDGALHAEFEGSFWRYGIEQAQTITIGDALAEPGAVPPIDTWRLHFCG